MKTYEFPELPLPSDELDDRQPASLGAAAGAVVSYPPAEPAVGGEEAAAASRREPLLKRPLDVILAALMLIASAPVWAAIALAIKLEDRGPVFYRQERWGRGGRQFAVLKFRTMHADAEQRFGV